MNIVYYYLRILRMHYEAKYEIANALRIEGTERCKFVRAKLRESFCPAAVSHSRPHQAGA